MSFPASNDNSMELPVKEEPVRAKEKDNKDNQNEPRPKPTHKKRPHGKKQTAVDPKNMKPTETNKTKPSAKTPDDNSTHGTIRASSKVQKKYPIDDVSGDEQEVPTPALTLSRPEATPSATSGQEASQPSVSEPAGASQSPKLPRPYPILFAEASRMCVSCVKLLKSDANHRCPREIRPRNCERCVQLNKHCIQLPRPMWSTVARLLKNRADADFGQQVEGVIEELDVYAYGRHDEGQDETLHLLRSINRNIFRIANLLKIAADGEEYGDGEAEVDEGVFGVV